MKHYLTPNAELIALQVNDVITTSAMNLSDAIVQASNEFWGINEEVDA